MIVIIVIVGDVTGLFAKVDHGVHTADAPPLIPDKVQLPAVYTEFVEFGPQAIRINPQVNKGAQGHIAGDTGITIKVQRFHRVYTSSEAVYTTAGTLHRREKLGLYMVSGTGYTVAGIHYGRRFIRTDKQTHPRSELSQVRLFQSYLGHDLSPILRDLRY
jgi:hypothetical protein